MGLDSFTELVPNVLVGNANHETLFQMQMYIR